MKSIQYTIKLMVLLALVGCGGDPQTKVVHEQSGSTPVIEDAAATSQSDALADGGAGGEKGTNTNPSVGDAGQGGVQSVIENAGSPDEAGVGGEAAAVSVDAKCPQGHRAICDGPGADGGPSTTALHAR